MKKMLTLGLFLALSVQATFAGAPLKGIDVKLGKNPGGNCAARTTDADGRVDFGVWPKGNYTIEYKDPEDMTTHYRPGNNKTARITAPPQHHVVIEGAVGGRIERDFDSGEAAQRNAPIPFSLDGKSHLILIITIQ